MQRKNCWTSGLAFVGMTILLVGCGPDALTKKALQAKEEAKAGELQNLKAPEKAAVREDDFPDIEAAIAELNRGAEAKNEALIAPPEAWLVMQANKAVKPVSAVVRDSSGTIESRIIACRLLPKLGPAGVDTVVWASETKAPPPLRLKAIDSLGRFKPPPKAAIDRLGVLLDEQDQEFRMLAAQALANVGAPAESLKPKLEQMLETEKVPLVRRQVEKAIRAIGLAPKS